MSKMYDSLDYLSQEIRVITLLPGLRDGSIECILQSQHLNDPSLEFEALSYEWGEPDPAHSKQSILIDGEPFSVRGNLWEALHHLRDQRKQRRLWIDAICINQIDLEERSHQVGLVGDIYRTAASVNVWLGHEVASSRRLFKFPYRMQKKISRFLKKWSMNFNEALNREDFLCTLFEVEATRCPFSGLLDLLKRRYWTRIWIVQEFILARNLTIYCGWDSIDWKTFLACLIWIFGHAEKEDGYILPNGLTWGFQLGEKEDGYFLPHKCRSPPESVPEIQDSIWMKISMARVVAEEAALWELMETCSSSTSSDPRDRIYALLALAHDVPGDRVANKSVSQSSAEDIFQLNDLF
jgi:hypothetical protein